MTFLDWVIIFIIILFILRGLRAGLSASALSIVGLLVGAYIGYRIAPLVIERFSITTFASLVVVGIVLFAALLVQSFGGALGASLHEMLRRIPILGGVLGALDGIGGALLGGALGVLLIWIAGIFLLQAPLPARLQMPVRESIILNDLNERIPESGLLNIFARLDPIPQLTGPNPSVAAPSSQIARDPDVRRAGNSVVRITGLSQGYGVEGSGWVAGPNLVVTNAHVVEDAYFLHIQPNGSMAQLQATVIFTDRQNDLAVLRVNGLSRNTLELARPKRNDTVAVLGFPENGPYVARAGRVAATGPVIFANTSNGGRTRERYVTILRTEVLPGNSGGPVVDADGNVVAVIFAGSITGSDIGYAIPASIIRADLSRTEQQAG